TPAAKRPPPQRLNHSLRIHSYQSTYPFESEVRGQGYHSRIRFDPFSSGVPLKDQQAPKGQTFGNWSPRPAPTSSGEGSGSRVRGDRPLASHSQPVSTGQRGRPASYSTFSQHFPSPPSQSSETTGYQNPALNNQPYSFQGNLPLAPTPPPQPILTRPFLHPGNLPALPEGVTLDGGGSYDLPDPIFDTPHPPHTHQPHPDDSVPTSYEFDYPSVANVFEDGPNSGDIVFEGGPDVFEGEPNDGANVFEGEPNDGANGEPNDGANVFEGEPNDGANVFEGEPNNGANVFEGEPNNGANVFEGEPNNGANVFEGEPNNGDNVFESPSNDRETRPEEGRHSPGGEVSSTGHLALETNIDDTFSAPPPVHNQGPPPHTGSDNDDSPPPPIYSDGIVNSSPQIHSDNTEREPKRFNSDNIGSGPIQITSDNIKSDSPQLTSDNSENSPPQTASSHASNPPHNPTKADTVIKTSSSPVNVDYYDNLYDEFLDMYYDAESD
ncbi:hypothetical protein Hamer_G025551, partial [Homarus americanus]